jgi:hypothetical protein
MQVVGRKEVGKDTEIDGPVRSMNKETVQCSGVDEILFTESPAKDCSIGVHPFKYFT